MPTLKSTTTAVLIVVVNIPGGPAQPYPFWARFSHGAECLTGTAGFGFWNAPFGDPTLRLPALPQATWFFYASAPTDLPFNPLGPGRGWFAATLDATTPTAVFMAPLTPFVLILNQIPALRRRIWPPIRHRLGISYAPINIDMTQWHHYELNWLIEGCVFSVNNQPILTTPNSPLGPLGFVCWLDNQYLVATTNGRLRWGTLATKQSQWLEVSDLTIQIDEPRF